MGASSLAKRLGISPLVIGLTIVTFGTSMPELVVNMNSAFRGTAEIAIGNIVGSNIFNVFWILGLTGTILQLPFNPSTNVDVLVGIAATALLFLFMFIGKRHRLDRWQEIKFVGLYVVYLAYLIQRG